MKILAFSQVFPRYQGDTTAPFLLQWCEALHRENFEVTMVVPHAAGLSLHETWENVTIRRFRYGRDTQEVLCYTNEMHNVAFRSLRAFFRLLVYLWSAFWAVRTQLRSQKYDRLVVHWGIPSGVVALALRITTGQRYTIISHGTDIRLYSKLGPLKRVFRPIWSMAEKRFTVSNFLERTLGMECTVLPMPLSEQYESPRVPPRDDSLFRILYVGRLSEQKRVAMIIEALMVRPIPHNWRLGIVGDGATKSTLQQLSAPIAAHIEWYDPVSPQELPVHYGGADVMILPSVNEGFGLVLVEAMAYGCYLLGADSGAIPEIITDDSVGLLFSTVQQMRDCIDTCARSHLSAQKSSAHFTARYAPSRIAAQWAAALGSGS